MQRVIAIVVGPAVLAVVLGAAAPRSPLEFVRAGNAAFADEDFERAISLYLEAEDGIDDPGLVAFNKGAALYRLGRFGEAEVHYLRCLEQAAGPRRARLLYDYANAILQQGQGRDKDFFDRAIAAYQECIDHPDADELLRANAQHNLGVARAMQDRAKPAEGKKRPNPNDDKTPDSKDGPSQSPDTARGQQLEIEVPDDKGGLKRPVKTDPNGEEGPVEGANQPPPGPGALPPIPDDDETPRLPRHEAREHLRRATQRILDDAAKRQQQRSSAVGSAGVLDW
jgi:tetratricopeptide (TPR) repeat protein